MTARGERRKRLADQRVPEHDLGRPSVVDETPAPKRAEVEAWDDADFGVPYDDDRGKASQAHPAEAPSGYLPPEERKPDLTFKGEPLYYDRPGPEPTMGELAAVAEEEAAVAEEAMALAHLEETAEELLDPARLDSFVYQLHLLKHDTKEQYEGWRRFRALITERWSNFKAKREARIKEMNDVVRATLSRLKKLKHKTDAGVTAMLRMPSMNNVQLDVDVDILFKDHEASQRAIAFPFVTVKREYKVDAAKLKSWLKDRVVTELPGDKPNNELKMERIARFIELANELEFVIATPPDFAVLVSAKGFDPITELSQFVGEDAAEEILQLIDEPEEHTEARGA